MNEYTWHKLIAVTKMPDGFHMHFACTESGKYYTKVKEALLPSDIIGSLYAVNKELLVDAIKHNRTKEGLL